MSPFARGFCLGVGLLSLYLLAAQAVFGQTTYTPLGPPAGLAQPLTRWDSQGGAQPCMAYDMGGLGVTVICPGDPQPDLGVPASIQDEGDAGNADE